MGHKTEQEAFWAGQFGTEYSQRNAGNELLASNLALFAKALRMARPPRDCIEFGANIGMNLQALRLLFPDLQQHAVEINRHAAAQLKRVIPTDNVVTGSILEFGPSRAFDLVLIKGVLIHVNPDFLSKAYEVLHRATGRNLLVCEYYNPTPMEITYRGHGGRLFKRDFCGELMERYNDLHLVDYGFVYRKDPNFPQDDITWFLMEKHYCPVK